MKTLILPFVRGFADIEGFATASLSCVPWPDAFPYKPEVTVRVAHDADSLLVRFEVKEEGVRAVCLESNGPVWEDDCVEFFVKVPGSRYYFNFETNCLGVGLAAKRLSRSEFNHFDEEEMAKIVRRSSLECKPVDLEGRQTWSLELQIPFSVLDCGPKPAAFEANFYKCGDKTAVPHYTCWNPILLPEPDFHRPDFFGRLELEW